MKSQKYLSSFSKIRKICQKAYFCDHYIPGSLHPPALHIFGGMQAPGLLPHWHFSSTHLSALGMVHWSSLAHSRTFINLLKCRLRQQIFRITWYVYFDHVHYLPVAFVLSICVFVKQFLSELHEIRKYILYMKMTHTHTHICICICIYARVS